MKCKISILFYCASLFILIFLSKDAEAYPRFAAYTGDKCADCHVDPNGGTMRHGGGIEYAKNNLTMDLFKKIAGKTQFSPKLTKSISVGGDVRVAQVDNEVPGSSNFNNFLAMQGDLYVNAKLNNILNVFVTSGIQIPNIRTKYEVYGMISNLPANLYMKVGRYKPNYGLRIVEHRAYQRQILLSSPYDANTGFEVGISPEWLHLNFGIYNPMNTSFLTLDPHKMVVASTDFNFGFNDNKFNVNIGGSFLNNPYNTSDTSGSSTITANKKAWGAFTRIGIMRRVALLGEIDFEENRSDRPLTRSLFGFAELDIIVIKGFEIRGQYELYDMNREVDNDHVSRISAGVAFFPFFGFETEAMVRFVMEDPEVKDNEFQWNFHFYF
ncbi:MAG: hypothetical protein M3P82_06765 [Bacteroidota bacterium]|nr:hypothetical protein [Bacteroidota bacterium]